jgi:hypothetical protein
MLANRACKISIGPPLWCEFDIYTLEKEVAFCLDIIGNKLTGSKMDNKAIRIDGFA